MFNSILVPIDLSHTERAAPMLKQASELCKPGGKITAMHVVPVIPAYVSSAIPSGLSDDSVKAATKQLEKVLADNGSEAEIVVRNGIPANTILSLAEKSGIELILVASHDPNISDYFLGSTAAKLVRHAHCSVLVMR